MKTCIALLALAIAASGFAQNTVPVYLDPTSDAPKIGDLETISMAVPADWPTGVEAHEGWQPVYYRGTFQVYVDNNGIGKDLAPKPGSIYFLGPSKDSTRLTIATDKDKTDILSVDTWWCKLRLETILVGYIHHDANDIASMVSRPTTSAKSATTAAKAVKELVGTFERAGLIAKSRVGLDYKLTGADGKPLAFIDTSSLPERVVVKDFLDTEVRISGALAPNERGDTVILLAQTLKKAN